jgi:para-nitrobenzyl esterase
MARFRPLRASLALLSLAAVTTSCGGPTPPSVEAASRRSLRSGDIVGFTGRYQSHVWRGIPYAAPPFGGLRWRAPQPPESWEGVREALTTGNACPQFASVFAGEPRDKKGVMGDEDCLYLDVYAPRMEPGDVASGESRLPVMVWIHGGGNSIGRASFYDGGKLAATHELVVVVIHYRLGPFGWFRHAALRGAGTRAADRSGNFGTLDTIRALEWVQENVAVFGGDPGNVTVFGESAGGRNVLSLLLSPLARGLFHRAVIQSGGMGGATIEEAEAYADADPPGHPYSSAEILVTLLVGDGTEADEAAARSRAASMNASELESYLRGKSRQEILMAYVEDPSSPPGMLNFPQVFHDGWVLPREQAIARLARGAYNQVPVILGTNRDENKLFMAFDPELARWRLGLFPKPLDENRYQAQAEHQANAWKARSVDRPAALMRAAQGPSVYAYRWDWDEEVSLPFLYDGPKMLGASHGFEIPFVFGHWNLGPDTRLIFGRGSREGRERLSGEMMSYWAEFAYSGSPGRGRGGDLLEWPAWDDSSEAAPRYIVFDTPADGGLRLASETFTVEKVVAQLLDDPRLADDHDRCAILRSLTEWRYLSREEYAASDVCGSYLFDAYPWLETAAEN